MQTLEDSVCLYPIPTSFPEETPKLSWVSNHWGGVWRRARCFCISSFLLRTKDILVCEDKANGTPICYYSGASSSVRPLGYINPEALRWGNDTEFCRARVPCQVCFCQQSGVCHQRFSHTHVVRTCRRSKSRNCYKA